MPVIPGMERYFNILATIQAKKFSKLVIEAEKKVLEKLNSDTFSEKFRAYLTPMNVGELILGENGQPLLHANGEIRRVEIEPYTNFAQDPAQVSQIKKLINALYNAKLALQEAEEVNLSSLRTQTSSLLNLYSKTITHAYRAGHLATHLDVNFFEFFGEEIAILTPLFTKFKGYVLSYQEETQGIWARMDRVALSQQAGRLTGIFFDQLDPKGGEPDFEFLAQFGAVIPSYLDDFTSYIEQLSSSVSRREPSIDRKRLDELQDHALRLLNALDSARGSSVFLPLQTLHYIHVIRHTITLATSIYEEAGHLSDTTQVTVLSKLEELKGSLASLLGFTDKIEALTMVTPGILSEPLIKRISRLYNTLIEYTKKFVDFEQKGQTLHTLEDAKFLAKRLDCTYDRIAEDRKAILALEEVRNSCTKFFAILRHPLYLNCRIIDLPENIRQQLAAHYHFIQPYVSQLNVELNNALITALNGERGFLDKTGARPLRVLYNRSTIDADNVSHVLSLESVLNNKVDKERTTREFDIELNTDIIASVVSNAQELKLYPGNVNENPFKIDEKVVLEGKSTEGLYFEIVGEHNQLRNPQALTTAQSTSLYKFYLLNYHKLEQAKEAYQEFRVILSSCMPYTVQERKRILRNLYFKFQPYLVNKLTHSDADMVDLVDEATLEVDRELIRAFNEETSTNLQHTERAFPRLESRFTSLQQFLGERREVFKRALTSCIYEENRQKALVTETSSRAHHIIKHVEFSKSVSKFRAYLHEQLSFFNRTVNLQLNGKEDSVPFPDLSEVKSTLEQSSQVVTIKQLFNLLYHLEQILLNLEKLHDQSGQTTYAMLILQVGDQLIKAFLLTQALSSTPYFSALIDEIKQKLLGVQTALSGLQEHYNPDPIVAAEAVQAVVVAPQAVEGAHSVKHTPIFYAVNAMLFLPEHIRALRAAQPVQQDAALAIHAYAERVTVDLERIINKSGSYWQLSSEIFTIYRLFRDLKEKLLELTNTTYDAVSKNLGPINDKIFTQILLELDRWEDNVGLKPGILTKPVQAMFHAFYKSMLQSLDSDSQTRIALMASVSPIEQRRQAAIQRAKQAENEQKAIQEKQQTLEKFLKSIRFRKGNLDPHLSILNDADLIRKFSVVFPILSSLQDRLGPDIPSGSDDEKAFDRWLCTAGRAAPRRVNNVEVPALENIEALTEASISYFKGMYATQQLTKDTANEKITYLDDLLLAQPGLKTHLVDTYSEVSFKKRRLHALAAHRVGLIDPILRQEYQKAIEKYLHDAKDEIISLAKVTTNIDTKIEELLSEKIAQFKEDNYKNYYHLDKIMGAITRLQKYVDQPNHLFESYFVAPRPRVGADDVDEELPDRDDEENINTIGRAKVDNLVDAYGGTLHRKKKALEKLTTIVRGQDDIPCGLLKTMTDPTQSAFEEIERLTQGKNAVILFNNQFYFSEQGKREIKQIVTKPYMQNYAAKLKLAFTDTYKLATPKELYLINSLRGHTPMIADRIANIKDYLSVHGDTFKTTMCHGIHHKVFTWEWLQQCVAWLLEMVWLYTPERKACYLEIKSAVNTEPVLHPKRLGFFPSIPARVNPVHGQNLPDAPVAVVPVLA